MRCQPLGQTGVMAPAVILGTSCLGNLYEALPEETKLATVREMIRHCPGPVAPDYAGKYGAGLALEVVGRCLRKLRVPLREAEPTFERGVWAHLQHDAERRISYDGIRPCYEQGCALLGAPYRPALVSVHDPDQVLAAGGRMADIVEAHRALCEFKSQGEVRNRGGPAPRLGDVRLQPDGAHPPAGVVGILRGGGHGELCRSGGVDWLRESAGRVRDKIRRDEGTRYSRSAQHHTR